MQRHEFDDRRQSVDSDIKMDFMELGFVMWFGLDWPKTLLSGGFWNFENIGQFARLVTSLVTK
jgi:hypothetical protein